MPLLKLLETLDADHHMRQQASFMPKISAGAYRNPSTCCSKFRHLVPPGGLIEGSVTHWSKSSSYRCGVDSTSRHPARRTLSNFAMNPSFTSVSAPPVPKVCSGS